MYSVVVLKFSIFWAISQSEPAAIPLLEGCLDMSKILFSKNFASVKKMTNMRYGGGEGVPPISAKGFWHNDFPLRGCPLSGKNPLSSF